MTVDFQCDDWIVWLAAARKGVWPAESDETQSLVLNMVFGFPASRT